MNLKVDFVRGPEGLSLVVKGGRACLVRIDRPVQLSQMEFDHATPIETARGYDKAVKDGDAHVATCKVEAADGTVFSISDRWRVLEDSTVEVARTLKVVKHGLSAGFRMALPFQVDAGAPAAWSDYEYMIPPVFFKHNDLDFDGQPDWHGRSFNETFREDRLTAPFVLALHKKSGVAVALFRANLPKRDNAPQRGLGDRQFLHDTDIGSLGMGYRGQGQPALQLEAHYPYLEGDRASLMLYRLERKTLSCAAFASSVKGAVAHVTYRIRIASAASLVDAFWDAWKYAVEMYKPQAARLPFTLEDAMEYRVDALNRFYREWPITKDGTQPAGFVINFHPDEGKIIHNVIEWGWTGRNCTNAYAVMRHGYAKSSAEQVARAKKIVDFTVRKAQEPNGFINALYNVESDRMGHWWFGYLLPFAFTDDKEELDRLVGPVVERLQPHVDKLKKVPGNYIRAMCEEAFGILLCYEASEAQGEPNEEWLGAARKFADFLLPRQHDDGSWGRAYDSEGREMTRPREILGLNEHQQRSTTYATIPFLVKLSKATGERKYLKAAERAGDYVIQRYIDTVEFCGGLHDMVFIMDGLVYDDEGVSFVLAGMVELFEATGSQRFLDGAAKAAKLRMAWIYLWDVPLPADSTAAKHGFRSTGWGQVSVVGGGWVHVRALWIVSELLKLAEWTGDSTFVLMARLIIFGQQQTLGSPHDLYGNSGVGVQGEGYFVAPVDIDDAALRKSAFRKGQKGEGNRTSLGWIYAVGLLGSHKVRDTFGTLDFDEIEKRILSKKRTAGLARKRIVQAKKRSRRR